jgi:hypothetical protein
MGPMTIDQNHPLHLDSSPVGLHSTIEQESSGLVKKYVIELAELYESTVAQREDRKSAVKNGGHSREQLTTLHVVTPRVWAMLLN